MVDRTDARTGFGSVDVAGRSGVAYDAGLRAYMLSIYNYMASGVLLTGMIALVVGTTPALLSIFFHQNARGGLSPTIPGYIVTFAPLAMILFGTFRFERMSVNALRLFFFGFAALIGVSMANIFFYFTGASIAQTFFVTAGAFAGLSLYGYTTKRDLSGLGKFLLIGLFGLILSMLANMFIGSGPFQLAINMIGVLIFAGLTVYDTQMLKSVYFQVGTVDGRAKAAIWGALQLYLDFINMFRFLLSFMGDRR
ncbi:MAG: Bax inhibitor-1/YccA family protein [Sphingomonadaceae bacterium]|nr:Bax inhibitor-1/YccA family protein [Sphingomonadaceae bacterium]